MTERINGTLAATESAEFAHTSEWVLQCSAASSKVRVTVLMKIEAAADYVEIDEFSAKARPISRYVASPFIKVKYEGNVAGQTFKAWTV